MTPRRFLILLTVGMLQAAAMDLPHSFPELVDWIAGQVGAPVLHLR